METNTANEWSFLEDESDAFTVNLSKATLIECMDKYVENKMASHPSVKGNIQSLKKHVRRLEFLAKTRIMPRHVTSIFYAKFVETLTNDGLKLSTIANLCNGIRAVLSWASDYSAPVLRPTRTWT